METKELNESENPTIKTTGESFCFFGVKSNFLRWKFRRANGASDSELVKNKCDHTRSEKFPACEAHAL